MCHFFPQTLQTSKDVLSLDGIRIDESGEESDESNEVTLESSTDDDFEEKLKSFEEYEESFSENSDRDFKSYVCSCEEKSYENKFQKSTSKKSLFSQPLVWGYWVNLTWLHFWSICPVDF